MLSSHAVKPAIPPNPMEANMNISQLGSCGIKLAVLSTFAFSAQSRLEAIHFCRVHIGLVSDAGECAARDEKEVPIIALAALDLVRKQVHVDGRNQWRVH